MVELTDMKKLKWEMKKKQFKEAVIQKLHQGAELIRQNRELLIVSIPAAAAVGKSLIRRGKVRNEERNKNLYCYDRSLGHYWRLRRPLTNKEWTSINSRKKNGETLGDILESMKLLK